MTFGASTLDTGKLRKVRELMDRGATAGEQAAARAKAERLASDAGMTLQQALSTLDTSPKGPTIRDVFAGFDDWMEGKEPGYKARKAAERAEKERKRLTRCQELLRQYGSEDAVFAPTAIEQALRAALEPFADPSNHMWGYEGYSYGKPTPAMLAALSGAVASLKRFRRPGRLIRSTKPGRMTAARSARTTHPTHGRKFGGTFWSAFWIPCTRRPLRVYSRGSNG